METLEQWQSSGLFLQFDAADGQKNIFYRTTPKPIKNTKPVLLLMHGFPTSSWDWARVWEPLSEIFELITLDMLGLGFSDKPKRPYSIFEQADIHDALLKSLGVTKYHILAHDYGDTVAQELLARDAGNTIESVIFTNGGLFPETHRPVLIQKLLFSPIGKWVARLASFRNFKNNFARICAKPIAEDELRCYWDQIQLNEGKDVMPLLIHYMYERRFNRSRWVGAIENTSIPLFFVNGALDPISGAHVVSHYRKSIRNAQVCELSDTGHYPQIESPTVLVQCCRQFWASINLAIEETSRFEVSERCATISS